MSVRVSEEVVRWGLRFFLSAKAIKCPYFPHQQLAHIRGSVGSQTCHVGSVRFYSQGRVHSEAVEEKRRRSSPLGFSALSADTLLDEVDSEEIQKRSLFSGQLQACGSPTDVLDLTLKNTPNVKDVSNCLTRMWSIIKKMSEKQRRFELQLMFEHPEFDQFLKNAMAVVEHMSSEDLAYSLLAMVKLGVPQGSRVVQTFLRSCQEKLNDFDEKGLSVLASSLEQMEDGTNVGALKEGIRLVAEARLPGIKNVLALQTIMRMLGKDAPLHLKGKFERKALSMADDFSLPNTQFMISTMAAMGFYSKPLLDICSKTIKENLNGTPFNRLFQVLHSCRQLNYRDIDLLTDISEYVASILDVWTQRQVVLFLSVFEGLAFCPAALMEVFVKKVIADPAALTLKDLLCVLKVYSYLNYDLQQQRQQFLESLSQALGPYLPKMSGFELLKAVYYLSLLGHFPSAPLEQLLQTSTLEKLNSTLTRLLPYQERMFQTVNLCLGLDRPPLPEPLAVPPSLLGDPVSSSLPVKPWLSQGLQSLLAGRADTTLQEMVVVENFYLIDGVITRPPPSQTSVTEASRCAGEERPPAESGQRIAVISTPLSGFCFGTSHPRGILAVKIRHLKILGYEPVLITLEELQAKEQRTEFLRAHIFPEPIRSNRDLEGGR